MTWTEEQKKVIETRGCSLLVSAAAGSGKTAVLVERIIRMITDREHPVDIDRLLVMTFTNAAAAEMRERIGDALEKCLEESPGDKNVERQAAMIHHARITTIDSFCLSLLREHFNELDIDPGFRVADEGELLLLQADVMKELLEDYYSQENPEFIRFADTYASGKADGGLEDYILQVWRFSQSNPWPGEWIAACKEELAGEAGAESFENTKWMQFLIRDVGLQAEEFSQLLEEAKELAEEEDGPAAYLPMLKADLEMLERLKQASGYREIHEALSAPMFGRLGAARGKQLDPEKKERASALRNRVKDGMKKMKALYAPGSLSEIVSDLDACRAPIRMLLELAEEFTARFQEAKEEKNLVDFNDLEHFALEILTGGSKAHTPGPVADELAGFYEEILVDEYQDSNQVQETLLQCISRTRFGTPNVFMVGDVKQSIYQFRLAKPELFMEKYETYQKETGLYRKIELHRNFRSRSEVLDSINDVFYSLMTKALGNIRYTEDAALYPGASYPAPPLEDGAKTELLLLNTGEAFPGEAEDEQADYTAREAEARLIASKIREYTDPETGMKIWNGKTGEYEPVRKQDMVILLRSMSGWAEEFVSVLGSMGISAYADSRTGYFTATEVETMLNMLAVINNPEQDIPLAGVLRSPIGGLDDKELAAVMAAFKRTPDKGQETGFLGAVRMYLRDERNQDDPIWNKLSQFWTLLEEIRSEAEYLPVHRLLYRIFEKTGYYDYVSVMPSGKTRKANLDMLVEKAAAFEKTSYQGLFDFIRYIEKLKKYNTDFGEARSAGEKEDAVRIMSIHKSKGLEFPVVFLAGAGKPFNRQDARGKILIDEELGVATDFFDIGRRLRASTLKKNVVSRRSILESMGEELRILYVAMTRAREKLVITAADRYLENKMAKWGGLSEEGKLPPKPLPFTALSAAGSFLDWLLMASGAAGRSIAVKRAQPELLLESEKESQMERARLAFFLRMLREQETGKVWDSIAAPYPYEADLTLHAKMSVSELKERGQFVDDGESDFLPTIPDFMRKGEEEDTLKGGTSPYGSAFRGTAYHRALELLPFREMNTCGDVEDGLKKLSEEKRMEEAALRLVSPKVLFEFFCSPTAERMKAADRAGRLHKESQFVIGIPAREMDEADSDETVLIQGIIDAWFEEEDGIVLVDYKTDRISPGQEHVLLERYRLQLVYYARALFQMTGKRVKEAILYSLTLQTQVLVPIILQE